MPIKKYFGGHGSEVMQQMVAAHGEKTGKREFYATANKQGQKPALTPTKQNKVQKLKSIKAKKKFGGKFAKDPNKGIDHGPNNR